MILYWIRTDVRLDDNPALEAAANLAVDKNEPLVALFVETPEQWEKHDRAPIQIDFLERHLNLVKDKLAELNVPLIFESAKDFDAQIDVCTRICKEHNVTHVFLNQELEINEVNRDTAFKNRLNESDIECSSYEADVVLPKGQVLNK
ncbi:deoxyribodipyrimidine photo-lyase, partial [Psychrosphaera sp.]|nr:deoxyribodipyrimidine photo-lyase [Psychrosphaera sp.]